MEERQLVNEGYYDLMKGEVSSGRCHKVKFEAIKSRYMPPKGEATVQPEIEVPENRQRCTATENRV